MHGECDWFDGIECDECDECDVCDVCDVCDECNVIAMTLIDEQGAPESNTRRTWDCVLMFHVFDFTFFLLALPSQLNFACPPPMGPCR